MDCKERIEHALKAQAETVAAYEEKIERRDECIEKLEKRIEELNNKITSMSTSKKPNILDIAEEQPKDIQNLIESVDLLVSQLDDSIGDEFDRYNLDMVKDSLNNLIK